MADFIYPIIQCIWEEETTPKVWNEGIITSIFKGKGDKEKMENHRGITVGDPIGTIVEEVIDKTIEENVTFTQSQGGGKKGASPRDYVFILRSIIDIVIKQEKPLPDLLRRHKSI